MQYASFLRKIKKYLRNKASTHEKDLLEKWLDTLEEKKTDAEEWSPEEKEKNFQHILQRIDQQELQAGKVLPLYSLTRVWKVAAAILLLATVSILLWRYERSDSKDNIQRITSTANQSQKVILPDGSIVWLRGNSTLSYPAQFDGTTRNVSLNGQALFEVAKDSAHPFIITCNQVTATVLGTSFNIITSSNKTEVNVLTGKVRLTSSQRSLTIIPNETAIYTNNQLMKKSSEPLQARMLTEGTQYDMRFEDVPVGDVMDRLEDKFNIILHVEDSTIRRCRITADFTDQSLPNTLQVMTEVLHLHYEINKQQVIIKGEGCQ